LSRSDWWRLTYPIYDEDGKVDSASWTAASGWSGRSATWTSRRITIARCPAPEELARLDRAFGARIGAAEAVAWWLPHRRDSATGKRLSAGDRLVFAS